MNNGLRIIMAQRAVPSPLHMAASAHHRVCHWVCHFASSERPGLVQRMQHTFGAHMRACASSVGPTVPRRHGSCTCIMLPPPPPRRPHPPDPTQPCTQADPQRFTPPRAFAQSCATSHAATSRPESSTSYSSSEDEGGGQAGGGRGFPSALGGGAQAQMAASMQHGVDRGAEALSTAAHEAFLRRRAAAVIELRQHGAGAPWGGVGPGRWGWVA
jgi:hypothetical protein